MKRLVLASISLVLGTVTVIAQDDPIATRQTLMKNEGQALYRTLANMVKEQTPYDQAIVDTSFDTLVAGSKQIPSLFPESTKNGPNSHALATIWDNKADFDARYAKLAQDVAAAKASVKDLATLKTAVAGINKDCGGCHEVYREARS